MEDRITILIVDDEPSARESLAGILFSQGYQLVYAENGLEAIEKALAYTPDLILLDVMMPEMDGFEVCKKMRSHPLLEEVPILILTALDNRYSRLSGIEAGADDFIIKPVDRVELIARVSTITRLNRYRRLLEGKARFAWVVEQAGEGYLIVDEAGNIRYANQAARLIFGLPWEEDAFPQETFPQLLERSFRCEPEDAWSACCKEGVYFSDPVYLIQPESAASQAVWYEVKALSLPGTTNREHLLRIKEINEQVSTLLGMWNLHSFLSHKLRTPLSNLVFGSELLVNHAEKLPAREISEIGKDLLASSKRIEGEINEIMKFVHTPTITEGQSPTSVPDLFHVIRKAAETIGPPDVRVSGKGDLPLDKVVPLSRYALEIIFCELFENARKFHPKLTPAVEVTIEAKESGSIIITVQDDGIHLTPYQLKHALTPYFQAEKYFTGQIDGMGLGLATVASLIWGSGGDCRLANRVDREGVIFEIVLPSMNLDNPPSRPVVN